MDKGINQGGIETSEDMDSLQAKLGTARQMDDGQKSDGLNNEALRQIMDTCAAGQKFLG